MANSSACDLVQKFKSQTHSPLMQQAIKVIRVEPSYQPDEARRRRRLESVRRSRQKPEVKQKIREAERKRRLEKRLEKVAAKDSGRATKPESVRVNMCPV
ncbi:hypothetical protein CEXT_415901 [Caerostris extrusa]|uniref:Uncharacterized protein n=1 Tax=Caerostris extrusa TaxID=172846 RepID=A0AAV4SAD4_CAEEX|nr:hypothetical protein CEXT_415901 [Caerostris extrusa]